MGAIEHSEFKNALFTLLDETFDNVHGVYLDRGTSLFETLAAISAAEASIPVGGKCATLAAQVRHVAFYLYVLENSVRDPDFPPADWGEIWRTVGAVSDEEWDAAKAELRTNYERILALVEGSPEQLDEDTLTGMMAVVVHTAYHLGEIRQALCTLKP